MHQTLTVINVVEDYSADNTGGSDAAPAINTALQAVPNGPPNNPSVGAIVYFPRGEYLIGSPLYRRASFTRCIGEGTTATKLKLDTATWQGVISPTDPVGSFIFDLASSLVTDCTVTDMRIDGSAGSLPSGLQTSTSANFSGILCSLRDEIARVSLYDIWGYALWISDTKAAYVRVIDCEADLGFNFHSLPQPSGGNDCIGGGGVRVKIVRFYWMPTLAKNTALDFTTPGGSSFHERSVDIIDCINESPKDVVLEGLVQSTIRGNRFYGNNLDVKTDAAYNPATHPAITNPASILVADNLFIGEPNQQGQYVGGSCIVRFDGGIYCSTKTLATNGGRVAILGNKFLYSAASAIDWAGDDASNSVGGSIISGNSIRNPNMSKSTGDSPDTGGCGTNIGSAYGCGIAVRSSYGLTIGRNTIDDENVPQNMQYAIQLISKAALPSGATTQPIIVTENICGSAPGVGNGAAATFYLSTSPTAALPAPIIHGNTNQPYGFDPLTTNPITKNTPWPGAAGYPYNALICISGGGGVSVQIDGVDTNLTQGAFYLAATSQITVKWTGTNAPTINVFRLER